jgi:hypothetical protein
MYLHLTGPTIIILIIGRTMANAKYESSRQFKIK